MHIKKVYLLLVVITFFLPTLVFADNLELTSLIEKGESLIEQGSYPAGIAILETVLTKDPKNTKVLSSLLGACDSYSQKLMAENNFQLAQNYIKKMDDVMQKIESVPSREFASGELKSQSRIKREMVKARSFMNDPAGQSTDLVSLNAGREHYNEAVQYFNQRQYDIAEDLLKESIKLDQSNPYAYELLGEIANLKQQLDEAERYYKQAFLINSDSALRAKYEKLIREKNIDKNQQQYEDEHFIIRYRRNESIEGSDIREFLREAYKTISQDLGHYPKYKIPVVLYDREEYQRLMGSVPHWSGALFDGKIRIPVYLNSSAPAENQNVYDVKELKKLIYHELTHAFVLDLSQMKCPIWLNEGLAQYYENKIKTIDLTLLKNAVKLNTLLTKDELMFQDLSKVTSHEKALLYYLESFSLVSYILKQRQMFHVKKFIIELGKGTSFMEAFERSFGRSFNEIATNWQKELTQSHGQKT